MTTARGRHEVTPPHHGAPPPHLEEAFHCVTRGLVVVGVRVAMAPVNVLPPEPRHHVKAAGRELARAFASLVRIAADTVETLAHESETTHRSEATHGSETTHRSETAHRSETTHR